MSEWVYILTNPSIHGQVKVGKTTTTPKHRAKQIGGKTGVPTPFEVAYQFECTNCHEVEKDAHRILSAYRTNPKREFFTCSLDIAIDAVMQAGQPYAISKPPPIPSPRTRTSNNKPQKSSRLFKKLLLPLVSSTKTWLLILFIAGIGSCSAIVSNYAKNQHRTNERQAAITAQQQADKAARIAREREREAERQRKERLAAEKAERERIQQEKHRREAIETAAMAFRDQLRNSRATIAKNLLDEQNKIRIANFRETLLSRGKNLADESYKERERHNTAKTRAESQTLYELTTSAEMYISLQNEFATMHPLGVRIWSGKNGREMRGALIFQDSFTETLLLELETRGKTKTTPANLSELDQRFLKYARLYYLYEAPMQQQTTPKMVP